MRGLMYTTQCTKSHIYLYFLEYVQEIFSIEQDKEGLDLLRIIDTKKVTEKRRKAPGFSRGDG